MLNLLETAFLLETALKLPFAAAWDVISLGNMGDGLSTEKVLDDYEENQQIEKAAKIAKILKDLES
jgi:hypothetical protein